MADLVCVAFDDPTTADRALTELTALQKEYLIELKDARAVVTRLTVRSISIRRCRWSKEARSPGVLLAHSGAR